MIVIRLSKKLKKFYYINVIYKKNSVYGKIIKRIGYCDFNINYSKNFYLNYKLFFFYIKKGAKISKRLFFYLKQ